MPLWLLGIGSFLKANWKVIAIVLAIAAVFFWYRHQVHAAYNQGKADCNAAWQKKADQMVAANQIKDKQLTDQLNAYAKELQQANDKRIAEENQYTITLKQILASKPIYKQCVADQSAIDELNKIRALGPK